MYSHEQKLSERRHDHFFNDKKLAPILIYFFNNFDTCQITHIYIKNKFLPESFFASFKSCWTVRDIFK